MAKVRVGSAEISINARRIAATMRRDGENRSATTQRTAIGIEGTLITSSADSPHPIARAMV